MLTIRLTFIQIDLFNFHLDTFCNNMHQMKFIRQFKQCRMPKGRNSMGLSTQM